MLNFTKHDIFYIIFVECGNMGVKKNKGVFFNKKISKGVFFALIWLLILTILFCLYYFVISPQIHLKGKKRLILSYNEEYKEKGFKASFLGKDITKKVVTKGKVNKNKLGEYKISYSVKKGFFYKKVTRIVLVKDNKKPVLDINNDDVYICPGSDIVPEKIVATDDYDGDLSSKVKNIINKEKNKITYKVTDSSGNTTTITKKIFYKDVVKPVIKLNGNEQMNLVVGSSFEDPLVTVTDNCDSDLSNSVKVEGIVDTSKVGEYVITYSVKDAADNEEHISRKVFVREREKGGTIYLTFDDGPNSGTTNVILDILKEEGVKATFFVTNNGDDYLIKREFDEGHTVALHTASHNYATIYSSVDAYFQDLYSVQERVKRITGEESKIIRFPGGSSNTVSRKYSAGIMSTLTQEVLNRGFKYYDWNLSSGDAGETTDPNGVYRNVVNNLRRDRVNMVLMHDIKSYTRDALRNIIRYGKENGYTFDKITMNTEMITQRVNN